MKRFYNNTKMSGAFSKALRVVALLCVLLGVNSSALADAGFHSTDAWNFLYYPGTGGDTWVSGGINNGETKDLGTLSGTPYMKGLLAKTWKTKNAGNVCSVTAKYKIDNGSEQSVSLDSWSDLGESSGSVNQQLKKEGLNIAMPTTPGAHTISFTFTANVNKSGTGNCNATVTMNGAITYTIAAQHYWLKHPWDGSNWSWKELTYQSGTTYTLTANYGGNNASVDYNTANNDNGKVNVTPNLGCSTIAQGTSCTFTFDSNSKTVNITPTAGCGSGGDEGDDTGDCRTIYLKPNDDWKKDGARFAAYFFGNSNGSTTWVSMESSTCDGLYKVAVPSGYPKVVLCRMNGGSSNNAWDATWDQTDDLTLSDNNNLYTITTKRDGKYWYGNWSASSCTDKASCSDDGDDDDDDTDIPVFEYTEPVLLTRDAVYDEDTNTAKLWGYMQQDPGVDECSRVTFYGFYYCEGAGKIPTASNSYIHAATVSTDAILDRGFEFTGTLNNLTEGTVYAYRAYIYANGKSILSDETRYFSTGGCIPIPGGGDTIRVTVDGLTYATDTAYYDDCALVYGDLQTALNRLKNLSEYVTEDNGSYNLKQPIVITVHQKEGKNYYWGEEKSVSGGQDGNAQKLQVLHVSDFNKGGNDYNKKNKLIIRAAKKTNDKGELVFETPRIAHMLIRSSRNVELDALQIFSNPSNKGAKKTTALELDDSRSADWANASCTLTGANILVHNCYIGSNGFTGVHVNGIDGLTFENNEFQLTSKEADANAKAWGASAKFLECKNIKFVRNNFMGAHTTLLWIQQVENALFYNNVFWNTNEISAGRAVRVYNQFNTKTDNIAILYNSFYVADHANNNSTFDFLSAEDITYGSPNNSDISGDIYFQYNNCYSYDADVKGKKDGVLGRIKNGNYCPNNFWSVYDQNNRLTTSKFAFGSCDNGKFVNVSSLVCETSATGPGSLVIRQPEDVNDPGLKLGDQLTASQVKGMVGNNINITDAELKHDRYRDGIRSGSKWTLGAYEGTAAEPVTTAIYWLGGISDEWDNRNNWGYINKDGKLKKLTCVELLPEDLHVIIPKYKSTQYPTGTSTVHYYPTLPEQFDATARKSATVKMDDKGVVTFAGIPAAEQVSAGVGKITTPTKFAGTIELEYGAALKGVEVLDSEGVLRYDKAVTNMTVDRDKWTLVGPVVKPFDENGNERDVLSGDYFLNFEPDVYMHEATATSNGKGGYDFTWGNTFSSLTRKIEPNTAFAVSVPDRYGDYKLSASVYYTYIKPDPDKVGDATVPKSFRPFEGYFVNDDEMLTYKNLTAGQAYILNNSYPYNINAKNLAEKGDVYVYDYEAKSVKTPDMYGDADVHLKPQHGFIFVPNENGDLVIKEEWLAYGDTKSRSLEQEQPTIAINLHAGSTLNPEHSTILIKYDEFLGKNEESASNSTKVFSANKSTPDLYMNIENNKYAEYVIASERQTIPLGIYVNTPMYVEFTTAFSEGFSEVTLVDAYTGRYYDLLNGSYTADILPASYNEGRYYLNLKVADSTEPDDDNVDDGNQNIPGDDVTTDIEDNKSESLINIYVDESEGNSVCIVTDGIELQDVYISDMAGRTMHYYANGYATKIDLPVAQGVYTVNVIGDTASRAEKVILK